MALRGIKVLEFAGLAPGPYCGEKICFYEFMPSKIKDSHLEYYLFMANRYGIVGFWCYCYKNRSTN